MLVGQAGGTIVDSTPWESGLNKSLKLNGSTNLVLPAFDSYANSQQGMCHHLVSESAHRILGGVCDTTVVIGLGADGWLASWPVKMPTDA